MVLTNVFLHGRLGKLYGHEWKLAVKSPAEAIRAIDVNTRGRLKAQLYQEGTKKFYKICVGNVDNALEKSELHNPSGKTDIHIVPVAKGKISGVGKILAAAAIVAAIIINPANVFIAAGKLTGWGIVAATTAASLALGGITQLLTPLPNFNNNTDGDGRGSNLFQGNSSISTQGSTVGLVYGRMMVTPMPVAVAFDNYEQGGTPDGFNSTEYDTTYDDNGVLIQTPVKTDVP